MKICVFAYDFEHKRTQEGILWLLLNNYEIDCIIAAPFVKLTFPRSKIRYSPKGLVFMHPKKIAERFSIPYFSCAHNSEECAHIIKSRNLDLGVIVGARILKDYVIAPFKIGVLNIHSGLLPLNRGLDNLKWGILKGIKQGITAHLIDKHIDKGMIITQEVIEVYPDDTLLDIHIRQENREMPLMIQAIGLLKSGPKFTPVISDSCFKPIPGDIENTLFSKFEQYKKNYSHMRE